MLQGKRGGSDADYGVVQQAIERKSALLHKPHRRQTAKKIRKKITMMQSFRVEKVAMCHKQCIG